MANLVRFAAIMVVLASFAGAAHGQAYKGEGAISTRKERGPSGAFNTTLWLNRPITDCEALTVSIFKSPSDEYVLEQTLNCPNETVKCWVGVRSRSSSKPDEVPEGMIWSIPLVNLTLTRSCTLRFTKSGDLQFIVSNLDIENGLPNHRNGEDVVWSTKTGGKGAVQVQLQDSGNLVLVHEDGDSVVWQSSTAPLLPLAPLIAAASSNSWRENRGKLSMVILSMVCLTTTVLIMMSLELHQPFTSV